MAVQKQNLPNGIGMKMQLRGRKINPNMELTGENILP